MALIEDIIRVLEEDKRGLTAREICIRLGLEPDREKEIYRTLDRISRILRRKGKRLFMIPPRCRECGFTSNRMRISKCPNCKSERIEDARFLIK